MLSLIGLIENLLDKFVKFIYNISLRYLYEKLYKVYSSSVVEEMSNGNVNVLVTEPLANLSIMAVEDLSYGFKIEIPVEYYNELLTFAFYTEPKEGCKNSEYLFGKLQSFIQNNFSKYNIESNELILEHSKKVANEFLYDLQSGKSKSNNTIIGVCSVNKLKKGVAFELFTTDYFTYKCLVSIYKSLFSIDEIPFKIETFDDVNRLAPFLCCIGVGGFLNVKYRSNCYTLLTKRSSTAACPNAWHVSFDETLDIRDHDAVQGRNPKPSFDSCLKRGIKEELGIELFDENCKISNSALFVISNENRIETEIFVEIEMEIFTLDDFNKFIYGMRLASDAENESSQLVLVPQKEVYKYFQTKLCNNEYITPEAIYFAKYYNVLRGKVKLLNLLMALN